MIEVLEIGIKEMLDDPSTLFSYWFVTGICNYKCDYCDVYHKEIVFPWTTKERIVEFLNYMGTIRNQKVLLYGGEPTLDPDFFKIVGNLDSYIRLFTNFSRNLDFFKRLLDIRSNMTISISYHISYADVDETIKKLNFLVDNNVAKIRLKIMGDSRIRDKVKETYRLFKSFETKDFEVYLDLVLPNRDGDIGAQWTPEDLEWFLPMQNHETLRLTYKEDNEVKVRDISWNEMRTTMLDSNNYYRCGAGGKNLIFIDSNGDVLPCKSHSTPLFNLDKNNFRDNLDKISDNGMICSHMGFCCETDFPKKLVCKRRIGEQTKNIRNALL
jgi:sulfatase maturation enzyme AslB (radical SAM superfamily)